MKSYKKLSLRKHTISRLNDKDMEAVRGRGVTDSCDAACPQTNVSCPDTRFCFTRNAGNTKCLTIPGQIFYTDFCGA